ncbi:hypothetical protein GCM10029976_049970 [Kribbella albertanoniae]|uniref:Uncharacterized protein n=1 Tax=Kribbella albertanoniae TaxID=1266829 RepID=A0A4R4PUY1_9ACTN|nr:hypothetical protein [Kribbella albertanoniae]TDC26204.1 hypothetical protein E1261_22905 [Kribbella albertanoniae]
MHKVLAEVRTWHRPLMVMVSAMAALVLVAAIGLLVDSREVLNESVWLKPFKFATSFVLYGATLAWLLSRLRKAKRFGWWTGTVFAVTGVVDVGFIAIQAARGTFSHFNSNTDTFNQVGQRVFSSGVIGLFGASLVIAIMLQFQRVGDAPLNRAIRTGVALAAAGMALAFYLVGSNGTETHTTDAYGRPVTLGGSHSIGAEAGGPGLPLVNWSTEGGDLRVAHFIGLHAIQVLLAVVLLLSVLAVRVVWLRPERVRARLVGVAVIAYTGLMVATASQAFRGQSVIHPDGQTLGLFGGFLALSLLLLVFTITSARRQAAVPETSSNKVPVGGRLKV